MNKILKLLILNDLFFWTALGFVGPIFAIYINEDIAGSTLGLTGLAMALYWIIKSFVSIMVSRYTDADKGNRRELTTLIIGMGLAFIAPIGFLFAVNIWQILAIQIIFGIGAGLIFPGWMTIFTRFLETNKEGYDWSVDSAMISLGNGVAVAVSGFVAASFGFRALFYLVIVLNFTSLLMIIFLLKYKDVILSNHNKIKFLMRRYF